MLPHIRSLRRAPPDRAPSSGEYATTLRHWLSFSYSDVGFAGHDQGSPQIHYLTSTAVFASPRKATFYMRGGYPGSHYYRSVYLMENNLDDASGRGVRVLNRILDEKSNGATILAEPVLPHAPPDLGVTCGSWQYLFDECIKKHGDLVSAKCEYQRCKLYECTANYYKNNAADGV